MKANLTYNINRLGDAFMHFLSRHFSWMQGAASSPRGCRGLFESVRQSTIKAPASSV